MFTIPINDREVKMCKPETWGTTVKTPVFLKENRGFAVFGKTELRLTNTNFCYYQELGEESQRLAQNRL